MNSQVLVLFSGGQDSTTCLAQALSDYPDQVESICFNYGQRHKTELQQATIIAKLAKTPLITLDLSIMSALTENALTRPDIKIDHQSGQLPSTFVDGRNHIFLSFAAIYAKQKGIKKIYTGVCQTDFSGYPDCRDEFIKSLNQTLNLAMDYDFEIITPLMWLTKAQTVTKMVALGRLDWLKESHTCYEGLRPACGNCPACKLRLKGFQESGFSDPLAYV
jgi:7-cyano-7-deazaguanine synthase